MSLKVILFSIGVVVLSGAGYVSYHFISRKNIETVNKVVDAKVTAPQAKEKNILVKDARVDAYAISFAGNSDTIDAGYVATAHVGLSSKKKMVKIAMEDLKIDNLDASGDCTTSEKSAVPATYIPGSDQLGDVNFKLSCHSGVTYSQKDVLSSTGKYDGAKMLSYGGLTPAALGRSLTFNVSVLFDDDTMTKESFSGTISGQKLFDGEFGAGSLSGRGDNF